MRPARVVLVCLIVLLVVAACGSSILTDAELVWCQSHEAQVWAAAEILGVVSGVNSPPDETGTTIRLDAQIADYARACKAAYENR